LEFQPLFLLSTSSPSQLYHLSLHDALPICFLAIIFPILYALIDGLGSFADGVYLDELKLIGEESALIAYELTFLFCAILAYLYRSEEHTSELQSRFDLVCRLLLEKKQDTV